MQSFDCLFEGEEEVEGPALLPETSEPIEEIEKLTEDASTHNKPNPTANKRKRSLEDEAGTEALAPQG